MTIRIHTTHVSDTIINRAAMNYWLYTITVITGWPKSKPLPNYPKNNRIKAY